MEPAAIADARQRHGSQNAGDPVDGPEDNAHAEAASVGGAPLLAPLQVDDASADDVEPSAAIDIAGSSVQGDIQRGTGSISCLLSCVRRCVAASAEPHLLGVGGRLSSGGRCCSSSSRGRYHALLLDEEQDEVILMPLAAFMSDREQLAALAASFVQSSWVLLLLLGVAASGVAWTIDSGVLLVARTRATFSALGGGWAPDYALFVVFRVVCLLLGVAATVLLCPDAAGSGIPEMRSILGGFPRPYYLSARALAAKCLGLVLALGSGLSIGKEGPFVHLSSIIAHQLLRLPLFEQIRRSDDLTHHVLSAACAVGVTATFGTPIGGVLFSIEVTTSYYVTSNYWRAFFASVVGVVVFRSLNSLTTSTSLFTTAFDILPYQPYEMAFFLVLALVCGLLAAVFVRTFLLVCSLKRKLLDQWLVARWPSAEQLAPFVYAAAVALLFALAEYPVGSFMLLSQHQVIDDMFSSTNLTGSETTQIASDHGSSWTSPSLALNLLAYTMVRFFSTAISATVMVPCGIVTPVFAVGAAIGRLFGEMIVLFGGGHELAGGYAVVAAASFTAGVTGTVSIAVIVFELTSQLSYMVPVLLCVLVGRSVALFFSLDVYETISRQKHLPQWPTLTKQMSYGLVASDLMRSELPPWITRRQTLTSLKQVLKDAGEDVRVFPVVDDENTMILLGSAEREELESIVELWGRCLHSGVSLKPVVQTMTGNRRDSEPLAAFTSPQDGAQDGDNKFTPRSRHADLSHRFVLAGVTKAQAMSFSQPQSVSSMPVDLVTLELLRLDAENFHVHRDMFASHVILLVAVHKSPQLFVTARGKLLGVIHASDLLARSRRYTL